MNEIDAILELAKYNGYGHWTRAELDETEFDSKWTDALHLSNLIDWTVPRDHKSPDVYIAEIRPDRSIEVLELLSKRVV